MTPASSPANMRVLPDRPIRVCYLIDDLRVGGTETKLLRLIDKLDRSKVEPYFCLLRGENETSRSMEPKSCPVERLGVGSLHHPATLVKLLRFAKTLRKWQIDILQVQFPDSTYFGVLAGAIARVPRIVRTRFNLFCWTTPFERTIGRRIDGLYNLLFVDAMLADCRANADAALATERPAPRAIAVIENGFDPAQFAPPRGTGFQPVNQRRPGFQPVANCQTGWETCPTTNGYARVGAVANLRPLKRIDVLVEAAAILAQDRPHVSFEVAGDGPARPELERRIGELGLRDKFHLPGVVRDIPGFLAPLDIAVLCSESEGGSNALAEYMMAGRAIVATAVPGNVEMIDDGVHGLLVPPNDPPSLARAIRRLLCNPQLAARLGGAARRRAMEKFGLDTMIERYHRFYANLLHDGSGNPSLERSTPAADAKS